MRFVSFGVVVAVMIGLTATVSRPSSAQEAKTPETKSPEAKTSETKKGPTPPAEVEFRLVDDSVIKLRMTDEKVDLDTEYGKLSIPVSHIRKIDFGLRIPPESAKVIEQAIVDLGSNQFRRREDASAILFKMREKAMPSLMRAVKSTDAETAKRAEDLVEKLKKVIPERRHEIPDYDVVHTEKSRFTGRIGTDKLKTTSFSFGELTLKLADVIAMSSSGFRDETEVVDALPDPGSLHGYQGQVGKVLVFKVTGNLVGGSVWGTDFYTLDSNLARAAVHMGVLRPGQTGNVRVLIQGPTVGFLGSARNGVASSPYDQYPGAFRILPNRKD